VAAIIIKDLIDQSEMIETREVSSITRAFYISGISTASPDDVMPKAKDALALSSPAIARGYPHPTRTDHFCTLVRVRPGGENADGACCYAYATYEKQLVATLPTNPFAAVYEYDASLTQETQDYHFTKSGQVAPLIVRWWPTSSNAGDVTAKHETAPANIQVLKPLANIHVTKLVTLSSPTDSTLNNYMQYTGKVNSGRILNCDAYTLLLANVQGQQMGSTSTFRVRFSFIHRPLGWYEWSQFLQNGQPKTNSVKNILVPDKSNGWLRIAPYEEANFNDLPIL
jgi:hypothetical protein